MPPFFFGGAELELDPTVGIDCGAGLPSRVRGPVYGGSGASFSSSPAAASSDAWKYSVAAPDRSHRFAARYC